MELNPKRWARDVVRFEEGGAGPVVTIPSFKDPFGALVALMGLLFSAGWIAFVFASYPWSVPAPGPHGRTLTGMLAAGCLAGLGAGLGAVRALLRCLGLHREILEKRGDALLVRWGPIPVSSPWSASIAGITSVSFHPGYVIGREEIVPADYAAGTLSVRTTPGPMRDPRRRAMTSAFWRGGDACSGVRITCADGREIQVADGLDEGQTLRLLELLRDEFGLPVRMPDC